jgi:hypothetical protein
MLFRGTLVACGLCLAALLGGCTPEPVDEARAGASTTAPDPTPTPDPAGSRPLPVRPLAAGWPAEADEMRDGGTVWGVFLVLLPNDQYTPVKRYYDDAASLGYAPGMGEVRASAADGRALPFERSLTVSIYFDTELAAREFAGKWRVAFGKDVAAIHEVLPACL